MKRINIIESNEKKETKNIFIYGMISQKTKCKRINYIKIIIFFCIIIIYFIICCLYKNICKKINYIKSFLFEYNLFNNKFFIPNQRSDLIINKYKRTSIVWPLPKEIKFKPIMSETELKAFLYFMKPENIYFEFGSGGSTNIASYYKLKAYSVESDAKWHKKLKINGIIANFITIDLKVTSFGYPGKNTTDNDWKKYIQAYKKEYNADIILIDGRFRVACALDIFTKIRNDTIILIHDYEPRKEYHILENFYIKLQSWGTLALFLKKPNINYIPEKIYNYYIREKV